MSERQPLATEGSWVQIRDPHTLKSGDLRAVQRAMRSDDVGVVGLSVVDAIAVIGVEAWSLPLPVPSQDIKALDLMEMDDYRKLDELLAPFVDIFFPGPVEETEEQAKDESSPTEPSAAS